LRSLSVGAARVVQTSKGKVSVAATHEVSSARRLRRTLRRLRRLRRESALLRRESTLLRRESTLLRRESTLLRRESTLLRRESTILSSNHASLGRSSSTRGRNVENGSIDEWTASVGVNESLQGHAISSSNSVQRFPEANAVLQAAYLRRERRATNGGSALRRTLLLRRTILRRSESQILAQPVQILGDLAPLNQIFLKQKKKHKQNKQKGKQREMGNLSISSAIFGTAAKNSNQLS
jgi:hypothetical protein